MPRKIVNLDTIRRINQLLDDAPKFNPFVKERFNQQIGNDERKIELLIEGKDMKYQSELDTQVVSLRIDRKLLEWIDRYVRIAAVNNDARISRNSVINGFLETMKAVIEYREKTEWGRSHVEEIEAVLSKARADQPSTQPACQGGSQS